MENEMTKRERRGKRRWIRKGKDSKERRGKKGEKKVEKGRKNIRCGGKKRSPILWDVALRHCGIGPRSFETS
jgi:hypothetical protein